jgi:hypothetical protein
VDVFLGNPAGRLYRFLEHCRTENSQDTILSGWRHYVDYSDDAEPGEVLAAIAPMFGLPDVIEDLLYDLPDHAAHKEDFGPALDSARTALRSCASVAAPMGHMTSQYDAGVVTALRQCSRVLQRDGVSAAPQEDQFDEVRQRASDLLNAINEANGLPPSVRTTLLGYAHAALRDLDLYRVQGIGPLISDLDRLRGEVIRDSGLVSAVVEDKNLWGAIVHFSEALLVIAALVHTPLAISADVQKYQAELNAPPTSIIAPLDFTSTHGPTPQAATWGLH